MGARVVGVDVELPMIIMAKLRSKKLGVDLEVVLADAGALPFRAGVFDLSVSILALCFTRFPRYVIEEMRRVTKQGGGLVVGTLNKWSPYGIGKKIPSLFIESSYRHAVFQSPFELKTLLCAAEWHSTIFAFEWMPGWLLRVLYRTDSQLARIFKPFGAFLATKTVILTMPNNAARYKA
jgi:SAM-dependent methyltransferase